MKKLLYATVILIGFVILFFLAKDKKQSSTVIIDEKTKEISIKDQKMVEIIELINKRNSEIKTVYLANMPIKIRNMGFTIRASGEIAHKKEKFFRLIITHKITGKEMDLGSNQDIFWFWSKRISPPHLYFSKHENINNTNLKSAFNPMLMIESLNISEIKIKEIKSLRINDNNLFILEKRLSPTNETLDLVTIIDIATNKIVEKYLSNDSGKKIVKINYRQQKIFFEYYEENISMEWDLTNIKINDILPEKYWHLPKNSNITDIGI
jgi:hypothetical protein